MLANNNEQARFNMVAQQVRPCEIVDEHVLEILSLVPREAFVSEEYQGLAFADVEVPINDQQTMLKPLMEAQMLQALQVKEGDKVLEVGTGSGFTTACLAKLGGKVTTYELDEALSAKAEARLKAVGIEGVIFNTGDIFNVPLHKQEYDVIAVTGSVAMHSEALEDLLAPGGRMFIVVGEGPVMEVCLVTRNAAGNITKQAMCESSIPALTNAPKGEKFEF